MEAVSSHKIFCPHCNRMLPKSTYYRHCRLYYNVISQCWSIAKGDNHRHSDEEWDPNFEENEARAANSVEETWSIEDFTGSRDISDTRTDSYEVELPQGSPPRGEFISEFIKLIDSEVSRPLFHMKCSALQD